MKQEYILKKYVSVNCAAEAINLDEQTEVSECFLVENKPTGTGKADCIGFRVIEPEDASGE